jgi:putative transcriptional regulator
MSTTSKRAPLAERLKQGLTEGIEFARGDRELATTTVPSGRSYSGEEVVAIRIRRHMSQAQFAKLLAVNVKTLQSWEQGVRKPSKPTMRLLQIFDRPDDFRAVLIVRGPEVKATKVKSSSPKTIKGR